MHDVPTHHFSGSFVDLARTDSQDLVVFGNDLLNAYRQWPVRAPAQCGANSFCEGFFSWRRGTTWTTNGLDDTYLGESAMTSFILLPGPLRGLASSPRRPRHSIRRRSARG